MYFKRIVTDGLMQFSYLAGDAKEAFVIDPRADIDVYLTLARENDLRITAIFETHRNEDILSGAAKLGTLTGAPVYRSAYEDPGYTYGTPVREEDSFSFGDLQLKPLHTPGHTLGHLSYVLYREEKPYMIFTGDALFYGGVGRTDFYGEENLEKMTGLLYDSLFEKIRPLGDEVLFLPAHGAGSACGDDLDSIPWSTLGLAFSEQDVLPKEKEVFLTLHGYMRHKNPAFATMEVRNLEPGGFVCNPWPNVLTEVPEEVTLVDIRDRFSFSCAHFPGSLYVPGDLVPSYLGWFVATKDPIAVVADGVDSQIARLALDSMRRQGFDEIRGIVASGMLKTHATERKPLAQMGTIFSDAYFALGRAIHTLDVRKAEELDENDPVYGRIHIPLQELKDRLEEVPKEGPLYVVCRSGERATVAASYLASRGRSDLYVVQGGMTALMEESER